MRASRLVGFLAFLMAAAPAFSQDLPDAEAGATRWTTAAVLVCKELSPRDLKRDCFSYSGKFTVSLRELDERSAYVPTYWIVIPDGRMGNLQSLRNTVSQEEHESMAAAKAECKRRGDVFLGMILNQIFASCWGRPLKINKTETASGIQLQLVYQRGYLYLSDGILTSIQTSQ